MRLEISCQDRLGITQDVLDILVTKEIDLRGIEIDPAGKIFPISNLQIFNTSCLKFAASMVSTM